jgi:uroporphyrinogen-III synthase
MPFDGLRVLSLESRRAAQMEELIRRQGGEAFVAPSMREAPLERNEAAFRFAERLFAGEFDMIVLLTGVGTRLLHQLLSTRYAPDRFIDALRGLTVVARGSKPIAVCRELDIPVTLAAPEPNTWREILQVTEGRRERRIAVQEYGRSTPELIHGFETRGAQVTTVPVYQWALPEDTGPLREAVRRLAHGEVDVALFTTSVQLDHLFSIAEEMGLADAVRLGLRAAVIGSVGPTTTETLKEAGFSADLEPSHPKMGPLVQETAARAAELVRSKR